MAINVKLVKAQAGFCMDLMKRLCDDIEADTCDAPTYYNIWYHTRKQGDIIRLRRELNKLHKMLNPYGDDSV